MKHALIMLVVGFAGACGSESTDSPAAAARKADCRRLEEHLFRVSPQSKLGGLSEPEQRKRLEAFLARVPVEDIEQCAAADPAVIACMQSAGGCRGGARVYPGDQELSAGRGGAGRGGGERGHARAPWAAARLGVGAGARPRTAVLARAPRGMCGTTGASPGYGRLPRPQPLAGAHGALALALRDRRPDPLADAYGDVGWHPLADAYGDVGWHPLADAYGDVGLASRSARGARLVGYASGFGFESDRWPGGELSAVGGRELIEEPAPGRFIDEDQSVGVERMDAQGLVEGWFGARRCQGVIEGGIGADEVERQEPHAARFGDVVGTQRGRRAGVPGDEEDEVALGDDQRRVGWDAARRAPGRR